MNVFKVIALIRKHIGLLDRQELENAGMNRLRNTPKIVGVVLLLGKVILTDEVSGIGDGTNSSSPHSHP